MLIVTGANGQFGRLAVEALLRRVPAERVGVSVRDPSKAADLAERGVSVRRGDFTDRSSLADAFAGAERVLIVSVDKVGPEAVAEHRAAIEAAAASGARQILYTSLVDSDRSSRFEPSVVHLEGEAVLAGSGVPYTVLRNGFYAEFAPMLLGGALATGVLAAPADGPIAYTSRSDLAEAAAAILAEGGHEGEYVHLTGPLAVDLAGLAEIASEITGRPIRREVISEADHLANLVAHGVPEERANLMLGLYAAAREGQFTRVDPTLARILGRGPRSPRDALAASPLSGHG